MQSYPKTKSFAAYKREQAKISRHCLYPFTAFYTFNSVLMLALALQTAHPYLAIIFYLAGIPVWTFVEYLSHRYILHGRFKRSKHRWKIHKTFANKFLDPLHWEHHERPYDGMHISAEIENLLPLFAVSFALSMLFPLYIGPVFLAGIVQSYTIEEWVHHSVHFYNFRSSYFRYMKKHHFYHHTSNGMEKGFGLTSGMWDVVFKTRFPAAVRRRMYGGRKQPALSRRSEAL